jgi:hypothetical protein
MKKFIVPVLSVYFFISCSTDDTALTTVETSTTDSASDVKITKKNLVIPENPYNEYDFLGKIHAEILNDCNENYFMSTDLPDIITDVETIAISNANFTEIQNDYHGLDPDRVEWVSENAMLPEDIIAALDMSTAGKAMFIDFTELLEVAHSLAYNQLYSRIVAYENDVINNTDLTETDKQIILIAASTARYSLANNGGRPWKKTKCGINATASTLDMAESVTISVAVNLLTE